MKIKEVNFSLSHLFILILILSSFSLGQAKLLFAYDEHSGQAIEPVMTAPQSEGAKIVSKFEYEPIEFTPPKPERLVLDNGMIIYLLEDHELPLFKVSAASEQAKAQSENPYHEVMEL
jgi:hypothetical protein